MRVRIIEYSGNSYAEARRPMGSVDQRYHRQVSAGVATAGECTYAFGVHLTQGGSFRVAVDGRRGIGVSGSAVRPSDVVSRPAASEQRQSALPQPLPLISTLFFQAV
jgi:hypothetical protein